MWLETLSDNAHATALAEEACALMAQLFPICRSITGDGVRQTVPGEPFTYINNVLARDITAAYGMYFFAAQLLGDQAAERALSISTLPGIVDVQAK